MVSARRQTTEWEKYVASQPIYSHSFHLPLTFASSKKLYILCTPKANKQELSVGHSIYDAGSGSQLKNCQYKTNIQTPHDMQHDFNLMVQLLQTRHCFMFNPDILQEPFTKLYSQYIQSSITPASQTKYNVWNIKKTLLFIEQQILFDFLWLELLTFILLGFY